MMMHTSADLLRQDANRRVLLVKRPVGVPQAEDFAIDEVPIPVPDDGTLLVRNIYLSVDPAQRGWANESANYQAPVRLDTPMRALAVGQIVKSCCDGFEAGDFVYGMLGWQDYAVVRPEEILTLIGAPKLPLSAYAGPLGINGITAFIAFETLGRPISGETIVVSTAAGAVGSIVGQLARGKGCRTIGLAGGSAKVERCIARYKYDYGIDYRAANVAIAVAQVAPDGIDIYFDNVGGPTLDAIIRQMRFNGRIIQCGTASISDWSVPPIGPRTEREILMRRLSWNGFVVFDHKPRFPDVIKRLSGMIAAGELVYDEDIENGIEAAPGALAGVYAGLNKGKKLIKIGEA